MHIFYIVNTLSSGDQEMHEQGQIMHNIDLGCLQYFSHTESLNPCFGNSSIK